MRVEGGGDFSDAAQVPVDELAEADVVLDGAAAGAPADEEIEVRQAEGVLAIDERQADAVVVLRRRPQPVLPRPRLRLHRSLPVGHAPDLIDAIGIEVRGNR